MQISGRTKSSGKKLQSIITADEHYLLETFMVYSIGTVFDEICMELKWFDHGSNTNYNHKSSNARW